MFSNHFDLHLRSSNNVFSIWLIISDSLFVLKSIRFVQYEIILGSISTFNGKVPVSP